MTTVAAISRSDDAERGGKSAGVADGAQRVAVKRLKLTDFRNYDEQVIAPDACNVVLTGTNGAGKTNVLEAVSFLVPGRGLRGARLTEITRIAADADAAPEGRRWAVAAKLDTVAGPIDVGTGLDPQAIGVRERRAVRVDGADAKSQSALAEHAAVIWLTPQMDGLFIDGPGGRRRFLDRLVYASDPAHAGRVHAYEQAMRERARVLSERGQGETGWLDALEETMVEKGMAVAAARRDMVGSLQAFIAAATGPFPAAELWLSGGPEGWLDEGPALAAEDRLRDAFRANRVRDAGDGRTAAGPHRSDFCVRHAAKGRDAALCSTGEQKALLITLILAHARKQAAEHGRRPVLLLDEVVAHLDGGRRQALFDLIEDTGTQAWMTGTDAELFAGMRGRAAFFTVADGTIRAADG